MLLELGARTLSHDPASSLFGSEWWNASDDTESTYAGSWRSDPAKESHCQLRVPGFALVA